MVVRACVHVCVYVFLRSGQENGLVGYGAIGSFPFFVCGCDEVDQMERKDNGLDQMRPLLRQGKNKGYVSDGVMT